MSKNLNKMKIRPIQKQVLIDAYNISHCENKSICKFVKATVFPDNFLEKKKQSQYSG